MAHAHFPNHFHRSCQKVVTNHRKYLKRYKDQVAGNVVEIDCAGGCGKTVRVKLKNLGPGNILVCNDRATRDQCHHNLPGAVHGLTASIHYQSAGHFAGVQYVDLGRWSAFKAACKDAWAGFIFPIKAGLGMVNSR
ncbi:MAG: hypothetical protein ACRC8B_22675 [Aeromonas sobria]|uniref:hypothetical protein n=1 Tax=Aeromonas sobria TaxID=646 RepID=UPI003F2AEC61